MSQSSQYVSALPSLSNSNSSTKQQGCPLVATEQAFWGTAGHRVELSLLSVFNIYWLNTRNPGLNKESKSEMNCLSLIVAVSIMA